MHSIIENLNHWLFNIWKVAARKRGLKLRVCVSNVWRLLVVPNRDPDLDTYSDSKNTSPDRLLTDSFGKQKFLPSRE